MALAARWIRLQPPGLAAMRAACAGFARAQPPARRPPCSGRGIEDDRHAFALVAPLKYLPGRSSRWRSWALAPLVATYRRLRAERLYRRRPRSA